MTNSTVPPQRRTKRWAATWAVSLAPDDGLFVAMLATWVLFVALVSFVLLGWAGGASVLGAGGLVGVVTVAVQSRGGHRSDRPAKLS
jgi:hypothetical protein